MAEQKTGGKRRGQTEKDSSGGKLRAVPVSIVFWVAFFILVIGLFFKLLPDIKKNLGILSQSLKLPAGALPKTGPTVTDRPPEPEPPLPQNGKPVTITVAPAAPAPETVEQPAAVPAAEKPAARPPDKPAEKKTAPQPAARPAAAQPSAKPPAAKPAQTRDRLVYFTQVDKDGVIVRSRVTRKLPVSDSPMLDSLNSLLAGPGAEEQKRGLMSLIPQNTRILSAIVRGNTAYISFSEDFQYNTYGVEGYAAQLKQIIWTATEFPNITDVQILIEGRRVDYLGEGIWIGSPIGRGAFP
jgi:spore germination protein GerM